MTSPGPGYNYVAMHELRINGVIAFETGHWVPDSTIASQGWIVGADISAPGTVVPTPEAITFSGLRLFDVKNYGAKGNGTTDDTAAIQAAINAAAAANGGIVFFPAGVYIVGGALQNPSGANSQLVLPAVNYVAQKQITIQFLGVTAPSTIYSVSSSIGTTPTPDNHSIIKSTLATGTGACIGGIGPTGTLENFTNILFRAENLTVRTVANPTITAVDLSRVAAVDLDNFVMDSGQYSIASLPQPTTTTSYGLKTPLTDNGASTRLGTVTAIGFYTGIQYAEHAVAQQLNVAGCYYGVEFSGSAHASRVDRLLVQHCTRPITWAGGPYSMPHYVDIGQLDIEHATSTWMVTDYDIYDPSGYARGSCRWHVVKAGTGPDPTFTVNGGAGFSAVPVGMGADDRVWLPAYDMTVDTGTEAPAIVIGTPVRNLEDGASNQCRGSLLLPAHFVGNNATIYAYIVNAGAGTGNVVLQLVRQPFGDGVNITSNYVASASVTPAVGAQNVVTKVQLATGANLSARHISLSLQRQGAAGGDTFVGAIGLVGLEIVRDWLG